MSRCRAVLSSVAVLGSVWAAGAGGAVQAGSQADGGGVTAITNVTVISPERAGPLRRADVVIRNGRIAEVGSHLAVAGTATRIDGAGRFLIPGLIDAHVHVGHSAALDEQAIEAHPALWASYRAQVPRAYLAFGFTSVVDLDLDPADEAWFTASPVHPRLYSCGPALKVAGGYGAFRLPPPASPAFPNLVYEPEAARSWPRTLNPSDYGADRAVARAIEGGAICVKAFVEPGFGMFDWPFLHTGTLRQIRTAATARKVRLIVHATGVTSWRSAIDARADIIAHGLWVWPGDLTSAVPPPDARAVVAAAARTHTRVQPTLQTVAGERAFLDPSLLADRRLGSALPASVVAYLRSADGQRAREALLKEYREASPPPGFERLLVVSLDRTRATFKLMLQQRVPLVFGSDTPAGDGFGNPPGMNGQLELQAWADAGAPLDLVLRAATLDAAEALGLSRDLGSIEVGKRADLLLLRENPLVRVDAYDAIDTVFLDGNAIPRDSLRSPD